MNSKFSNSGYIKKTFPSFWVHICMLIVSTLIVSCSQISKLPASWEVSEKNGSDPYCRDISGIYLNKGVASPGNKSGVDRMRYPKYLSEYFSILRVNGFEHRWITHLEIMSMRKGEIKVVFKQNDRVIDTKTMHEKKDFACVPQGLKISDSLMPSSPYGPEYVLNEQIFYKVSDGSLIVKDIHSEAGVFALIPYGGTMTEYYRFPPFVENNP